MDIITLFIVSVVLLGGALGMVLPQGLDTGNQATSPQDTPIFNAQNGQMVRQLSRPAQLMRPAMQRAEASSNSRQVDPRGFRQSLCVSMCKFPREVCVERARCEGPDCFICAETNSVANFLRQAKEALMGGQSALGTMATTPAPSDPWADWWGPDPSASSFGQTNSLFDPFSPDQPQKTASGNTQQNAQPDMFSGLFGGNSGMNAFMMPAMLGMFDTGLF